MSGAVEAFYPVMLPTGLDDHNPGDGEAIPFLIENGADLDARNQDGDSA